MKPTQSNLLEHRHKNGAIHTRPLIKFSMFTCGLSPDVSGLDYFVEPVDDGLLGHLLLDAELQLLPLQ